MENPIKMDDLGGNTTIFGSTPISHPFSKEKIIDSKRLFSEGLLTLVRLGRV